MLFRLRHLRGRSGIYLGNEALLTRYFLDHAKSERERAYFLNHFLEQFRATLYRQTMFAEFELKVAELTAQGSGITADALCGIYKELNAAVLRRRLRSTRTSPSNGRASPTSTTASMYINTQRASQPPLRSLSAFWTWEKRAAKTTWAS